ncbi:MAG: O-antigen ligase family protein [Pseudorhodoplanes sp.]
MQMDQARMRIAADGLVAIVAAILPWSTSGTLIAIGLWFVVLLPTLRRDDLSALRHPAAFLPLVLFAFAALGMFWSDVSWKERLSGLYPYSRLLLLPLLFVQFRNSDRWRWVLGAFLLSCGVLMAISYIDILTGPRFKTAGIPARDYIAQAGEFTLCAMGLLYLAMNYWSERKTAYLFGAMALAILFLANVAFIATSRTALLMVPLLLALLAITQFRLSQTMSLLALLAIICAAIWFSSSTVQQRITAIYTEIQTHRSHENIGTSAGLRVEFWRQAAAIIRAAPVLGHGTGTVRDRYEKAVAAEGTKVQATVNPHNQILMVAIPLGAIGAVLLIAMWIAQFALFVRGAGLAAWIGLVIVAQNVIGGLFNTHLFDFVQGWIYIFGVGAMGGVMFAQPRVARETVLSSGGVRARS